MGFFKKVTKAVTKPVAKAAKAVVKDAVPLAAAYFTGGASLSMIKPQGNLMGLGKIINAGGSTESIQEVATNYVEEKAAAEANRYANKQVEKLNRSINKPSQNISSKRINSQSASTKPITESIAESFSDVASAVGGKSKLMLIAGGGILLVVLLFVFKRGSK